MRRPRWMTRFTSVNWKPPLLDVVIAAAFVAMTVAEAVFSPKVTSPVEHVVVAGLAMASLAWRRRAPLVVTALVIASNIAVNPDGEFSTLLSLVLVCFTVGSETRPPRNYIGLGLVVVPFLVVSVINDLRPSDLAAAVVFFLGPWAWACSCRIGPRSADEAVARAAQLEREREAEAARAAAEERTRIARELHDIVSHSISVVTIQTQAVRRRLGPEHAREAADLAAVEATAREALAEMRRLFGVLRTEGESVSLAPQPGLGELERLVRQVGSGDLHVEPPGRGRAGPAQSGGRPGGVPDRPGGPHQRRTACCRERGAGAGALRRRSGWTSRSRTTGAGSSRTRTAGTAWSGSASGSRCTAARWTWAPPRAVASGSR